MRMIISKTKLCALSAGLLGCFCFGGGDWLMIPESGFRLGFTNGLMSESMIIWFLLVFLEIGGRK